MSNIKIFDYKGSPVQFEEVNGQIMANATLMAKANNKKANDWLKTESAKTYIKAISKKFDLTEKELVTIRQGGNDSGTWIHEKLVLRYAQWLNVDFEIWCDDKLAELLRTGKVELSKKTEAEQILDVITMLQIKVENEKAEKEKAKFLLNEARPKVEYYDKVINAEGLFPITLIAQQAGMTARKLNEILKDRKIQRRVNGTWVLTAQYLNKGYANLKTYNFSDSQGKERTNQQLQWTEKGKAFIMELLGMVGNKAA